MAYEFFDKDGVAWVRINVGADTVEREATEKDHEEGEAVNAAEQAAAEALDAATKERIEREHAKEQAVLDVQQSERKRLDAEKYAIQGRDDPTDAELEKEFDDGLARELGEHNGKAKKGRKHAE